MKKIFILGLALLGTSCQTFRSKKSASRWEQLKLAEDVSCQIWPKKNEDLDTSKVDALKWQNKVGLISQGRARNTRKVRYYAPLNGSYKIDVDDLKPLEWGNDAHLLGAGPETEGGHSVVLLTQGDAGQKIELRSIKSNIVAQSSPIDTSNIGSGWVFPWREGFWLGVRQSMDDESDEDQVLKIFSVVIQKNKLVTKEVKGIDIVGKARIFPKNDKQAIAIWLSQGTSSNVEKSSFKYVELNQGQKNQKAFGIKLPINEEVESWDVYTEDGRKFFLAYVDGDSLLGNATLKVAELVIGGNEISVDWQKTKSLAEEHVAKPMWVKKGNRLFIVLQKWKDSESTLGAYSVDAGEIVAKGSHGIFEEGTNVQNIFYDEKSSKTFAVVKKSKGALPRYFICKLDEL